LITESHEQNVTASGVISKETESICIPNKSPGSETFPQDTQPAENHSFIAYSVNK